MQENFTWSCALVQTEVTLSCTDLLMRALAVSRFTWGRVTLDTASKTWDEYIASLREADGGDVRRLTAFVRS